jgi:colanic acid/amylovoran biosynthesis glycosyltransferase
MKIAFIVGQFPALSETFVLNQITGLIDRGHDVEVFAGRPGRDAAMHQEVQRYGLRERVEYFAPVPTGVIARAGIALGLCARYVAKAPRAVMESLNAARYRHFALSCRLPYLLPGLVERPRRYDIVHCHFGGNGLRAVFLRDAALLRGKIVTTFHGADVSVAARRYGHRVYDRLFAVGDLFLPISERWRNELLTLGAPPERTLVHHMGIDVKLLERIERRPTDLLERRLLSVCRLAEKKGIEYALRAFAQLGDLKAVTRYDIVGDGPLARSLQDLARDLGISERVTFHGPKTREEVLGFLGKADIFVQPSVTAANGDQEGIPVSLMEAMATGLPVVSTLHSGIPELVEADVAGVLIPERNVALLADAIRKLLTAPELCRNMGEAGRAHVQREYAIDGLNHRLEVMYDSILSE